jgi:hypothetical protein
VLVACQRRLQLLFDFLFGHMSSVSSSLAGCRPDLSYKGKPDKIGRRVISGKQGPLVYWRMKAGAHVAVHQHHFPPAV